MRIRGIVAGALMVLLLTAYTSSRNTADWRVTPTFNVEAANAEGRKITYEMHGEEGSTCEPLSQFEAASLVSGTL